MSNLKKTEKVKNDGVYVYLGPSIRGVIQTGAIYRGTRDEVLKSLAEAISKFPKIATLIVEDCDIAKAKEKIRNGVNSLSSAYKSLAE